MGISTNTRNEIESKPSIFTGLVLAILFLIIAGFLSYQGYFGASVSEIVASVLTMDVTAGALNLLAGAFFLLNVLVGFYLLFQAIISLISLLVSQTWKSFKNLDIDEEALAVEQKKQILMKSASAKDMKPEDIDKIEAIKTIEELKVALIKRKLKSFTPELFFLAGLTLITILLFLFA